MLLELLSCCSRLFDLLISIELLLLFFLLLLGLKYGCLDLLPFYHLLLVRLALLLKGFFALSKFFEEEFFLDVLLLLISQFDIIGPHDQVDGLGLGAVFVSLNLWSRQKGHQLIEYFLVLGVEWRPIGRRFLLLSLGRGLFGLLRHMGHGLPSLGALEFLLKFGVVSLLLYEELHDLRLVDLLVDELLSILARELVLGDVRELLVHDGGLLALGIEDGGALRDLPQAPDDRGMDEADRLVDVGVVDARDERSLGLLDEVLLDDADASHVLDVLVELGVDGHVLRAHGKALLVLVLVGYADDERNARGVLLHHVEHEAHSQVDSLDNQGLIPALVVVNDLLELGLNLVALVLVADECPLLLRLDVL